MARMKTALLAAALLAVLAGRSSAQEALFNLGDLVGVGDELAVGRVAKYAVTVRADVLRTGETLDLIVDLPVGRTRAVLRPIAPGTINLGEDQAAWSGVLLPLQNDQPAPSGEIFVLRSGDFVQARIAYQERVYSLRSPDGRTGVLELVDSRELLDHPEGAEPPEEPPPDAAENATPDSSCADGPDRIDVMVVYTTAARDAASLSVGGHVGDQTAIAHEIAFGISEANLALANSQAFHRFKLVSTKAVTYNEATGGGASKALLNELVATNDMILDEVHGWRDAAKADLVSLITAGGDCGWGNTVQNADAHTTANRAFTVINRNCLNTNISLAHELGHNLGALHDRGNSSTASTFVPPSNYGHIQIRPSGATTTPWRTVMAYNATACMENTPGGVCVRITQYSNPDVSYPSVAGDPTGVPLSAAKPEYNVYAFAQNDAAVARYRCANTGAVAVQMQSTDGAAVRGSDANSDAATPQR